MQEIIAQILAIFEQFRMAPIPSIDRYEQEGKALLATKLEGFVSKYKPIQFFMLGYPFKSLNHRDKTIGSLPDLGEELSLKNFATFNNAVKTVYSPGIEIHIASDGFVFNDILGESDHTVREYQEINEHLAIGGPVRIHNLINFYPAFGDRLHELREHFMSQWAITEAQLEDRILNDLDTTMLYRGMSIFMEEELAIKAYNSNNQRHKAAKVLTREMMRRNEAYGSMVLHEFSDMIKLSMHNSTNVKKYAFNLYPVNTTVHGSPWHTALLVKADGSMETVKRRQAEEAGYDLMWKDQRPYYFLQS
jgi:pyoverdine/dityrosine biosynthesis protein Dit1